MFSLHLQKETQDNHSWLRQTLVPGSYQLQQAKCFPAFGSGPVLFDYDLFCKEK